MLPPLHNLHPPVPAARLQHPTSAPLTILQRPAWPAARLGSLPHKVAQRDALRQTNFDSSAAEHTGCPHGCSPTRALKSCLLRSPRPS